MSSEDERQTKRITLENVIEQCGPFGRFQCLHAIFLLFFPVASGIVNFYFVFGAAEPAFICASTNKTNHSINFQWQTEQTNQTTCEMCSDWIYDQSLFGKTFTEEANLVCQHRTYRSLLATSLQAGAMFIFFTGQITDFIGRRRSMHLLVAFFILTSLITQALMQFAPISINQKSVLTLFFHWRKFFSPIFLDLL